MILTFETLMITTEKYSYNTTTGNQIIKLGSRTTNTNISQNPVNFTWKLKNKNIVVNQGNVDVFIGSFVSSVILENLLQDEIYIFEIDGHGSCTIFTGNLNNLLSVDENFIFPQDVTIYGDLVLSNGKLRFPKDWDVERTQGNAIVESNSQLYVFRPIRIFTRKNLTSTTINFTPYSGLPESNIIVHVIPKIEHVSPFNLTITPPSSLNIIFFFKKFRIDPFDDVFVEYDYENPIFVTTGIVSRINLLNYNRTFTKFKIEVNFTL